MKRDDKLLHDLQERAFWRVHRPPVRVHVVSETFLVHDYYTTLFYVVLF